MEPLRIYMYSKGLVRFASVPYSSSLSSYSNQYMHLTNYSINRLSHENGVADEPVRKWTIAQFWDHLTREGYDAEALKRDIQAVATKAIIACEHYIRQHQSTHSQYPFVSHELFGMDILIDSTLRPWLLEMNISPSLQSSTPVDIGVKSHLARDVLNMCGVTFPPRHTEFESSLTFKVRPHAAQKSEEHLQKEAEHLEYFRTNEEIRSDIISQLTDMDVRYLIDFEDEFDRRGDFELIYPRSEDLDDYLGDIRSQNYANLLLSEWQRLQNGSRTRGRQILERYCVSGAHIARLPHSTAQDEEPVDCREHQNCINNIAAGEVIDLNDDQDDETLLEHSSEVDEVEELK